MCNQEDRHRQRLTPRGLSMRMEQLVAQCEALLKAHIPDFDMNRIEEYLARQGIDPASLSTANLSPDFQVHHHHHHHDFHGPPKPYPVPYPGPHLIPSYPPPHVIHYSPAYPPPPPSAPPPPAPSALYSPFHPPTAPYPPPPPPPPLLASRLLPAKGTDPNGNDMSDAEKLATNFGVSPSIVGDLRLHVASDREDLAVDYNGLSSGPATSPSNPAIPPPGSLSTSLLMALSPLPSLLLPPLPALFPLPAS